ncbi:MAG TPA: septation protein SepH [Microbacteriaceae bacterium]|nr:septation protein SepH [Microbacteriaceae bacterium]
MQELEIAGVEDGRLILADDDGTRYSIAINERLLLAVRRPIADHGTGRRLSPKDIQGHIRGGMSAEDVAAITGAPLEYIQRFEGPVLAERQYVVDAALAVPVHSADADPLAAPSTFGDAILERLHIIGGVDERWSSWREATGWVVRLGYEVGVVEHDARWQFDPKRQSLSPLNAEAVGLSRVDPGAEQPAPRRLHAVIDAPTDDGDEVVAQDADRFDSGAFRLDPTHDSGPVLAPIGHRPRVEESHNQTADLLEALRRRRGERESVLAEAESEAPQQLTGSIRLVELEVEETPAEAAPPGRQHTGGLGKRKGRPGLPSWDEIVFGARSDDFDDDLA